MATKAFYLLGFLFYGLANIAHAETTECPDYVYPALKSQFDIRGDVAAETCKVWPASPGLLLGAFVYGHDDSEIEKDLFVVVFDRQTKRLTNWSRDKIYEDASVMVGSGSLRLDTARYELSKGVTAFGLRFNSSGPGAGCADGYQADELTLFVQDKDKLRPVFKKYMEYAKAHEGCIGSPTGKEIIEHGVLTISVLKTKTNGFFDLRLVDTVEVDTYLDNPPPGLDLRKRTKSQVLKYDGSSY